MFEILSQLMHFFADLVPRLNIMPATHKGVRYKRGKHVSEIGPGLYVYWPLVTHVDNRAVKRQTIKVPTQTIHASCGISISAGCVVVFEITDIVKALYHTWEIDETIADETEALLAEVIGSIRNADIKISKINKVLTKHMRRRLKRYGICVKRANLRDFAPSKVYRLIGENHGV